MIGMKKKKKKSKTREELMNNYLRKSEMQEIAQ